MKFELLNEVESPHLDLCEKYSIPSYEDYKVWAGSDGVRNWKAFDRGDERYISWSEYNSFTAKQEFAFCLVTRLHLFGEKPRYFVINKKFAIKLLKELGEIPQTFEDIPLVYDGESRFKLTTLM